MLWPKIKLPVIGVAGKAGTGKSLFAASIDPENTLLLDYDDGAANYESLGITRVDVYNKLVKRFKKSVISPIEVYDWTIQYLRDEIPNDKYSVIVLDTATDFEEGIMAYVTSHPKEFGMRPEQMDLALKWGPVKSYTKRVLNTFAAKCETLVFTAHMKTKWIGKTPTNQLIPKCGEPLMNAADLFLELRRDINEEEPTGIMLKGHTFTGTWDATKGRIIGTTGLPPKIVPCTPQRIRELLACPAHYDRLGKNERVEELIDRQAVAFVEAQAAEDNRAAEEAKLERAKILSAEAAERESLQTSITASLTLLNVPKKDIDLILQKRNATAFNQLSTQELRKVASGLYAKVEKR